MELFIYILGFLSVCLAFRKPELHAWLKREEFHIGFVVMCSFCWPAFWLILCLFKAGEILVLVVKKITRIE